MVKAQEWLDKWYPKHETCQEKNDKWGNSNENFGLKRSEVKRLSLYDKELESLLDLKDFISLEELRCSYNPHLDLQLEYLSVSLDIIWCFNCPKLQAKLKD